MEQLLSALNGMKKSPLFYFVAKNVAIDFEICNRSDSDIYENVKGTFLEF